MYKTWIISKTDSNTNIICVPLNCMTAAGLISVFRRISVCSPLKPTWHIALAMTSVTSCMWSNSKTCSLGQLRAVYIENSKRGQTLFKNSTFVSQQKLFLDAVGSHYMCFITKSHPQNTRQAMTETTAVAPMYTALSKLGMQSL